MLYLLIQVLDDDTFLGAVDDMDLFTLHKNSEAASDEDRGRLQVIFSPRKPLPSGPEQDPTSIS